MRSSDRLKRGNESPNDLCIDDKNCTCVLCYMKYVHRMWFASQNRLLVMYSPKDRELLTGSLVAKFADSAEDAAACRAEFLRAHNIVCSERKTQKRRDWSVQGSSNRKFGNIEDLIFMWYNMNMTLEESSYQHAIMCLPPRYHPLPYLPGPLRAKLYNSLAVPAEGNREKFRLLGATPPHPTVKVQLDGRAVELSATIKVQSQSCRRVEIEIWRKDADEKNGRRKRLRMEEMQTGVVRDIRNSLLKQVQPAYMSPQQRVTADPQQVLLDTLRMQELDYVNHGSDPGPYKYNKAISGTVTTNSLVTLFEKTEMNPNTIFLDIGSGLGEPMIAAAAGFQVHLALGLEVHKNRVQQSLRSMIAMDVSHAFPIHVSAEEISYFDPVTHVYCYTNGMDSCARNCIRESILSSRSVKYVMTDRKDLLRYESSEVSPFEETDRVPMSMAGSRTKRTFYILRRKGEHRNTTVRFHPIFALPLHTLRFDRIRERAFLDAYSRMLARTDYERLHFCASKTFIQGISTSDVPTLSKAKSTE